MAVWIAESVERATPLAIPTIASQAKPSASHCWGGDSLYALNDQKDPSASDDKSIPRFTWWDHRGTTEWVQYEFPQAQKVSRVLVYWWDERRIQAHCRVPQSWRALYQRDGEWEPVESGGAGVAQLDRVNEMQFTPVETKALRIQVQLQPGWSGGILEWRVE